MSHCCLETKKRRAERGEYKKSQVENKYQCCRHKSEGSTPGLKAQKASELAELERLTERSLHMADSARRAATHPGPAELSQSCESLRAPKSLLKPLNSSIYLLFVARNKYSPRSHFALSIVPSSGDTKMNEALEGLEFNREIDLQTYTEEWGKKL